MANDYRILDERDIKNFQAGNKLNVTEIDNKVTYEHIGEPPSKLPLEEKVLEYGGSFDITVPSVYDSTGHVKSEITYSFKMPDKIDISSGLTTNNFSANIPIRVNKNGNNITYSHDLSTVNESTTKLSPNDENIISFTALSAVDSCGHANQKTTYNFAIPDTSNYPTKNDFVAVAPLSVAKGENNNTVTYSHNTVNTPTETPTTVDLSYGNTFSFNALSAVDGYGHATKKTTYKFKMPTAPNVDTTGIITKNDFAAVAPLSVAKSTTGNTVTYSHSGSSPSENQTISKSLTFGGTFNMTVPSAYNTTGHVTATQPYTFTMPKITTKIITISEHTFAYASKGSLHQWGGMTGKDDDSITYINMDLGTFQGCYITVCPNVLGYALNGTYDDKTNPIVDVRLFLPGSITVFTNSFASFSFKLPRFYVLTPTNGAYHGFSYLGKSGVTCHMSYSNKRIGLYFACEKSYFDPTFIDKIIITTY